MTAYASTSLTSASQEENKTQTLDSEEETQDLMTKDSKLKWPGGTQPAEGRAMTHWTGQVRPQVLMLHTVYESFYVQKCGYFI